MLAGWFDMLFGCSHKRYSFPISAKPGQRRSQAAAVTGIYVVCLDCGREFAYDWANMKVVSPNTGSSIGKTTESPVQAKAA